MGRKRKRSARVDLARGLVAVAQALDAPRTAQEVARATRLHLRTVYRILKVLPQAGVTLKLTETPRTTGKGKPERRYQVTNMVTNVGWPGGHPAVGRASAAVAEAAGFTRTVARLVDELGAKVGTVRSLKGQLSRTVARLFESLGRAKGAIAWLEVDERERAAHGGEGKKVEPSPPPHESPSPPRRSRKRRASAPRDERLDRDRGAYFALLRHLREAHGVNHGGDRSSAEAAHEQFQCGWVNPVDAESDSRRASSASSAR
jgi:hypothetical protein